MNREISATDRLPDRLGRSPALGAIADVVQPVVRRLLDSPGPLAPVKDWLHGTPLEHPLHPAITDVPVGTWTLATVFDCFELAGNREFTRAADLSIVVGALGALAAVVTGYAEWADTADEPKRLGMAHAMLNAAGLLAYGGSLALRAQGNRGAGIALSTAGYGLVAFSAYLGGELSFGLGIGTKHTATPIDPPGDFKPVLAVAALGDEPQRVDLDGIAVLLSRRDGAIHAVSAVCTHRGAPLEQGQFTDGCVVCPWHAGRFDVQSGRVLEGPPAFPLARFDVRVTAGQIELRAAHASAAT